MRRIDLAEESYFNGDDEEDDDDSDTPGPHPAPTSPTLPVLHSPPLSRFQFAQKRRRQRTPGIPLRTGLGAGTQRIPAPATPIHLPRTPPINALVDYRDDDEPSSDPEDTLLESLVAVNNKPTSSSSVAGASSSITITTTPAPAPTPATATATTTIATSPSGGGGFVPLRAEKRRRAEEDEDELGLERLVAGKSRRPAKVAPAGTGEEGPKRIRLRFGAASLAAAAASTLPTAARSEPSTKDGDTG
jgi:protein phosphatase-4 regulatory subunit 3